MVYKGKSLVYMIICFILVDVLVGCRVSEDVIFYKKAEESQRKKQYVQAILFLNKAIDVSEDPQLLLQIARRGLYIIKNFIKDELQDITKNMFQIRYLRLILLYSNKKDDRLLSQEHIADIYFSHLRDYRRAIEELSRLMELGLTKEQRLETQLKIAKSYYYIGKLNQAKIEVEKIDGKNKQTFDTLFLKGHILLGEKNFDQAIQTYNTLIQTFPQRSIKDQVFLTLSTCYEEQKKFEQAIAFLSGFLDHNKNKLNKEQRRFIAMKVQRLQETHKMQPGVLQQGRRYRR